MQILGGDQTAVSLEIVNDRLCGSALVELIRALVADSLKRLSVIGLDETLTDLVVAAVRDASRAAQELTQEKMGPLAGGLGGMGLPGL